MHTAEIDLRHELHEYREVVRLVLEKTKLSEQAFRRHIKSGYFPAPRRLELVLEADTDQKPNVAWRWYTVQEVEMIFDLCRRRRWMKAE